ncbi:MAG: MFS transporter [Actinomycetota bacterium]|nr:MFS transporter [Actinomycetota bacterium]
MGFFTDAYDLFVVGAVLVILKDQWHLSPSNASLVSAAALGAAFFGAVTFGRIADLFGRKRIYGLEAAIMVVGALGSAFAPSLVWLILFRVIIGIGIGGDYPVSAVIMSEYANVKDRGRLIGMVFSMQAAGLVIGPLTGIVLVALGFSHDTVWRALFGLGAVPAAAVIYLRRTLPESPRYHASVQGQAAVAAEQLSALFTMDRIGHRRLQIIGFTVMGACFAAIAVVPQISAAVVPFMVVYGVSYFFAEFGPNTTTFVLSAELFPASIRTTGQPEGSVPGAQGGERQQRVQHGVEQVHASQQKSDGYGSHQLGEHVIGAVVHPGQQRDGSPGQRRQAERVQVDPGVDVAGGCGVGRRPQLREGLVDDDGQQQAPGQVPDQRPRPEPQQMAQSGLPGGDDGHRYQEALGEQLTVTEEEGNEADGEGHAAEQLRAGHHLHVEQRQDPETDLDPADRACGQQVHPRAPGPSTTLVYDPIEALFDVDLTMSA